MAINWEHVPSLLFWLVMAGGSLYAIGIVIGEFKKEVEATFT